MKKLSLGVQSVYLFALIPVMLVIILVLAWQTHQALYRAIMRGFDKQLVATSTTTGAFLDGARQHQLLTKRQITGLAFDAQQQVFYGVDNATGELVRIDPATGGAEFIGQTGMRTVRDVAFDPGRRLLYAIAGDALSEEAYLLRLDPRQALATRVGAIGIPCSGLAFDADRDILYCSERELVRLDLDTGRGRRIGPLGFTAVNGLAFQQQTGTLYGTDAVQKTLMTIDTNSGKGTALGPLRSQSNLSETVQPPAYLRHFLARFSEKPVPLSDEQIRGIEGEPPSLPVSGLAFGPDQRTLFASTTRLVSIHAATAVVRNSGFEGYRNELGQSYLDSILPMRRIQRQRGITYLYTFVQKERAPLGDFVYILDVNTDEHHSFIGDEDQLPKEDAEIVFDRTRVGKTYVSGVHLWELWGLLKTGYAPIRDTQGVVQAVVGTDINVTTIERKTRAALLKTVLLGMLALLLAGGVAYAITRRLVQPIRQVQDAALRVAAGAYGLTVPLRGPSELVRLATAFNRMSLRLKTSFEEKSLANRALEARVCRRELTRTLCREADLVAVPLAKVLCCRRFGGHEAQVDAAGWTATASRLLLWLGSGSGHALEVAKRRREIALLAKCMLQRYEDNWEKIASKLTTLLTDAVTGFAFLDADAGNIHVLTREPIGALVLDQSGVRQLALAAEQALSIGVNQAGIVGSIDVIDRIRPGVERLTNKHFVAEAIITSLEDAFVEPSLVHSVLAGERPSGMVVAVLSRYPWWRA
jgi:HAMP domain-containing protein/sugar lactone lactonase YvrE